MQTSENSSVFSWFSRLLSGFNVILNKTKNYFWPTFADLLSPPPFCVQFLKKVVFFASIEVISMLNLSLLDLIYDQDHLRRYFQLVLRIRSIFFGSGSVWPKKTGSGSESYFDVEQKINFVLHILNLNILIQLKSKKNFFFTKPVF